MARGLPVDPDSISYPLNNPFLVLSASTDPIQPDTGLKTPFDLYAESFILRHDLTGENKDNEYPGRFGLFTRELRGPEQADQRVGLSVPGAKGTAEGRNGDNGGVLELYVEDLQLSTVKKLSLNVPGGAGFSPPTTIRPDGEDGGNGGNGGHVTVIAGGQPNKALDYSRNLLHALEDDKKKWPEDFKADVGELVKEVQKKYVTDVHKVPAWMQTTQGALNASHSAFEEEIFSLLEDLAEIENNFFTELRYCCQVEGGTYGSGSQGTKTRGKSGDHGKSGSFVLINASRFDKVWSSGVCFVHPMQCRMLLEKANLLWFCGSPTERARASNIVESLQRRLAFLPSKLVPVKDISSRPLAQAYRAAEPRLCILSGPPALEPVSITQLRAIKSEVEATLVHINSGDDIYGWKYNQVPRSSYQFYQERAKEFLEHLAEVEEMYRTLWDLTKDVQAKREVIRQRYRKCEAIKSLKAQLMATATKDLEKSGITILVTTESIQPSKNRLEYAVKQVIEEIKKAVKVPFENIVAALSQVVFMHGFLPMAMLQDTAILDQAINKLETDSGVQVERHFIVKQMHNILGTLDGLDEGYKVLKDGGIDISDPGAEKLILEEAEFRKLIDDFSDILSKDSLKEVKDAFQAYVDIVLQRNQAVMSYNSALALLLKYQAEIDSLKIETEDLIRQEYDQLSVEHPTMLAFMKKLYGDAINSTQTWLYKAQRAYSFIALDTTNVIGEAMEGFDFAKFDSTTLKNVRIELEERYSDFVERAGQPPQTYQGFSYPLSPNDIESLQGSGRDGVILTIAIRTSAPPGKPDPFSRMVDIRLTKARLFADGATTSTQRLAVVLTHAGDEVILNKAKHQFKFTHDPLVVYFKYNLTTGKYTGPDTTDGDIGAVSDEKYALVGPFTVWKVRIAPDANPGLDLSHVCSARFEFDFVYRAI